MAFAGFFREKHLLSIGITRVQEPFGCMPIPGKGLQLIVTNLRNRPLCESDILSMCDFILSLYHNLLTGSKDYPFISFDGVFLSDEVVSPFPSSQSENNPPSPLTEAPAGVMVPPAGSSPPNMLTPVLPERTELGVLRADRRNYFCDLELDGTTVTRFISPVYSSECTELTNRWRVTDYSEDGHLCMSVLCQFPKKVAQFARPPRPEKRKYTEESSSSSSSSSQSPPKKRLRL
ncbi:uncharacterized protein LOC117938795 [Etheostoma cragini]|uniref:uncharacterized protein LOC117938795 n=1 Tax=Etheostoma cragini TaxID=417921 RepID=UPI00155F490B|nr:uncharacterized protein LOC117938795 [Etheostoma cragini]